MQDKFCCVLVANHNDRVIAPDSWLKENKTKLIWPTTKGPIKLSQLFYYRVTEFDSMTVQVSKVLCHGKTFNEANEMKTKCEGSFQLLLFNIYIVTAII